MLADRLKIILFFSLLIMLPSLYADDTRELFLDREVFVEDAREALLHEDNTYVFKKMAPFLKEQKTIGSPNCFECSLFLIKSSLKASGDKQLIYADLATKISPDLPEGHLHYLSRLIRFTPYKVNNILKEFKLTFKSFFNFPPRDAFFYSLLKHFSLGCLIFILVYFIIMMAKYWALIAHRYMHLVGHSRFYAFSLLLTIGVGGWILVASGTNWILVVLTFMVFITGSVLMREKIFLYLVFILMMFAEGAVILTGANMDSAVDSRVAINHLNGIYSPSSSDLNAIDSTKPGGSMAKGFMFYYLGNYKRASFHFKKELSKIKTGEIKASIDNMVGLSFAKLGNYGKAVAYLKEAYDHDGDIKTGFNLSKVLYEGGMTERATALETTLLEKSDVTSYVFPYHKRPPMFKVWRFVTSGTTEDKFENWIRFMVFILGNLFFYMLLLLVRLNYLKGLTLARCMECGKVMCSKCNAGGKHVCAVCRLMKADPSIFKRGEREKYIKYRENYFARHSVITMFFNVVIPGGGLIFTNRITEGSIYLFITIFIATQFFMGNTGLIYNIRPGNTSVVVFFAAAAVMIIYLISIVRGFLAARGD